jgi:hypothetical protein
VLGPSCLEVTIAIAELKKYKSPGIDQILAELIWAEGETLVSVIHKLINSIWNEENVPDQWKESTVVSVYTNSTLLWIVPLGRSRKIGRDWNWMGHISFWLMLMMWIYWEINRNYKRSTEILIDASKEVCLEVNIEKTKHMLVSHHQNARRNWDIKIGNGIRKWHSSHI